MPELHTPLAFVQRSGEDDAPATSEEFVIAGENHGASSEEAFLIKRIEEIARDWLQPTVALRRYPAWVPRLLGTYAAPSVTPRELLTLLDEDVELGEPHPLEHQLRRVPSEQLTSVLTELWERSDRQQRVDLLLILGRIPRTQRPAAKLIRSAVASELLTIREAGTAAKIGHPSFRRRELQLER